jgi:hypothetical protein
VERTKLEIVFAQAGGKQKPETFEGSTLKHILETEGTGSENFAYEQSGLEQIDNITFASPIELKA